MRIVNTRAIEKKKVTLMLDAEVYEGLREKVGGRGLGAYISQLVRPHVLTKDLEAGYKAMAVDEAYNQEAREWIEGTLEAPEAENKW